MMVQATNMVNISDIVTVNNPYYYSYYAPSELRGSIGGRGSRLKPGVIYIMLLGSNRRDTYYAPSELGGNYRGRGSRLKPGVVYIMLLRSRWRNIYYAPSELRGEIYIALLRS